MTVNTNITQPPDFLASYYAALAQRGMDAGNLGFQSYDQDRVAGLNQQQTDAGNMIQQRATAGSPLVNQAQDWYSQMMAGNNRVAPVSASYGPSGIASGGQSQAGTNRYLGMNNPYLNSSINSALGDVSSRINSQFNNNAFGGTAHQETLARQLGRTANDMRMTDYTAQMGLAENDVNRQLSNDQYNIGNQNQLNQYNANLGFQNAGIYNQQQQFNAGLEGQSIAQQASAAAAAPGMAAADYADANALMGVGNQLQQTNQQIADANYQEFLRKQEYPALSLSYMQQGLNPAGSVYQNQTSTSNTTANPYVSAIGGGLLGATAANYLTGT